MVLRQLIDIKKSEALSFHYTQNNKLIAQKNKKIKKIRKNNWSNMANIQDSLRLGSRLGCPVVGIRRICFFSDY